MSYAIHQGDCRDVMDLVLAPRSVQTCVTSPPYFGLRDYGHTGQIGLEPTPDQFVAQIVSVFRSMREVLADDGTVWLNLGDSYAGQGGQGKQSGPQFSDRARGREHITKAARFSGDGLKPKDLIGIPWRVALALQADGWWLRQDIIWHKPNPMPESVRDRCTKAHEYIFLLSKNERYFIDPAGLQEPAVEPRGAGNVKPSKGAGDEKMRTRGALHEIGPRETRNKRSVWTVTTKPYKGAHFATFPPDLIEPCILAGSRPGDLVLDPFGGSGTTAAVAVKHGRRAVLCELNPEYIALAHQRMREAA